MSHPQHSVGSCRNIILHSEVIELDLVYERKFDYV